MIFLYLFLSTYPWPIRPFDTAHGVSATLGDARATRDAQGRIIRYRFHRGIDIPAGSGTAVFSTHSGTAKWDGTSGNDARVRIDDHWYIHVRDRIDDGEDVVGIVDTVGTSTHPTQICEVRDYPPTGSAGDHLHFQIGPSGGPYSNPLNEDGGLVNYSDNGNPLVYSLDFWRSGSEGNTATQVHSPLWGKIDIRAECQDRQTSGGVNTTSGIYKVKWYVRSIGMNPSVSYHPVDCIGFNQVQPPNNGAPVLLVYDRHNYSASSPFYYWVTNVIKNNRVVDEYWNTKLRIDQAWNGEDARINGEAVLPDGRYRVWVLAYDIENNGGDTLARHGAEDEDVILDNFVPYVESVVVKDKGEEKYGCWWVLEGDRLDKELVKEDSVSAGDTISMRIIFSEVMDTSVISVVMSKGSHVLTFEGSWLGCKKWEGSVFIPEEEDVEGKWQVSIRGRDLAGNYLDSDPGSIGYRDEKGNWNNYSAGNDENHCIFVSSSPPPRVVNTSPSNNENNVLIDKGKVIIKFSKPMDENTTEAAISIMDEYNMGVSIDSFAWEDSNKTMKIFIDTLDYLTKYRITVSDDAMSVDSVRLDGDEDGEPGGEFESTFKTEKPILNLTFAPSSHRFCPPGGNITGKIFIDGRELKKGIRGRLNYIVRGKKKALEFFLLQSNFRVKPGESDSCGFRVISKGDIGSIYVTANPVFKNENIEKSANGAYCADTSGGGGQQHNDSPDENQSPGEIEFPTAKIVEPDTSYGLAKVGYFAYGWGGGFGHILGRYGIITTPVFEDLKYWKDPDTSLSKVIKLLVIGSGGLHPFLYDNEFKSRLADYVASGGNLLVLSQGYGEYFSVLPGNVEGYGWNEDQSCFINAGYMDVWHPVFSGQTRNVLDLRVDGYLSSYPDNAEVLLKRTVSGMPMLITYQYGLGHVMVTTLYSDWAYGHNQMSHEEMNLVRDLTTWAVNPEMEIPRFYPDSSVSVPVTIRYSKMDTVVATMQGIQIQGGMCGEIQRV